MEQTSIAATLFPPYESFFIFRLRSFFCTGWQPHRIPLASVWGVKGYLHQQLCYEQSAREISFQYQVTGSQSSCSARMSHYLSSSQTKASFVSIFLTFIVPIVIGFAFLPSFPRLDLLPKKAFHCLSFHRSPQLLH